MPEHMYVNPQMLFQRCCLPEEATMSTSSVVIGKPSRAVACLFNQVAALSDPLPLSDLCRKEITRLRPWRVVSAIFHMRLAYPSRAWKACRGFDQVSFSVPAS